MAADARWIGIVSLDESGSREAIAAAPCFGRTDRAFDSSCSISFVAFALLDCRCKRMLLLCRHGSKAQFYISTGMSAFGAIAAKETPTVRFLHCTPPGRSHENPLGLPKNNAPPTMPRRSSGPPKPQHISKVGKVIAVSSAKGGVGKSTVAGMSLVDSMARTDSLFSKSGLKSCYEPIKVGAPSQSRLTGLGHLRAKYTSPHGSR